MFFWKYTYTRAKSVIFRRSKYDKLWALKESRVCRRDRLSMGLCGCTSYPSFTTSDTSPLLRQFLVVLWTFSCFHLSSWQPVLDSKLWVFWSRLVFSHAHVCVYGFFFVCVHFPFNKNCFMIQPQAPSKAHSLTHHQWGGGENEES